MAVVAVSRDAAGEVIGSWRQECTPVETSLRVCMCDRVHLCISAHRTCSTQTEAHIPLTHGCHRCCWASANITRAMHSKPDNPVRDECVHQHLLLFDGVADMFTSCLFEPNICYLAAKKRLWALAPFSVQWDPYSRPTPAALCDGFTLLRWPSVPPETA